jgi:hypothetical protein
VARFKLSMARKFLLDVYWISQHENRVNSVLKDLTGYIYLCQSWMSGGFFTAKGHEPEKMRKKNQHLERVGYRFNLHVAELYDTLEVLSPDEHLMESAGMAKALEVGEAHNAGRRERCVHERRGNRKAGTCGQCRPTALAEVEAS